MSHFSQLPFHPVASPKQQSRPSRLPLQPQTHHVDFILTASPEPSPVADSFSLSPSGLAALFDIPPSLSSPSDMPYLDPLPSSDAFYCNGLWQHIFSFGNRANNHDDFPLGAHTTAFDAARYPVLSDANHIDGLPRSAQAELVFPTDGDWELPLSTLDIPGAWIHDVQRPAAPVQVAAGVTSSPSGWAQDGFFEGRSAFATPPFLDAGACEPVLAPRPCYPAVVRKATVDELERQAAEEENL
ncbi:hypothetical protein HMN09_01111600 [Mycena chlorophos]|uniref:Uncharacterized protein n=1 Tax=Mycena chlorophos TaxID=658473 RepID=A0A8H6SBK5_MYCCL|nr:hypothetical protein HMN09_01111600 [Mycena chlorophos]